MNAKRADIVSMLISICTCLVNKQPQHTYKNLYVDSHELTLSHSFGLWG